MKPDDAVPGAERIRTLSSRGGELQCAHDWVAQEAPVALQYNGLSHAVMLASPLDLEDFAMGFSLSEGLIDAPGDLFEVEVQPATQGIVLEIRVAARCEVRLKERRRTLAGRSGCGLCGVESLEQALPPVPEVAAGPPVQAPALAQAMRQLQQAQPLQSATGATHAAAWCTPDGTLVLLREDVGRHNALDKLIGALARQGLPAPQGFIAVTSRASHEMVQKTARAGVGLLAAISAPTTLAIERATQAGLCLVGFARGDDWVAYSHAARLGSDAKVAP
ncbi:MAG: formate dehydrogenase accessory sulfurtransferase FdhD [Pseudomonadota bacterium]